MIRKSSNLLLAHQIPFNSRWIAECHHTWVKDVLNSCWMKLESDPQRLHVIIRRRIYIYP